ncbi:hypothetical protein ACFC8N_40905 [Streptomyces sp. NPDC055966]|uniref:hypothetical protein n=1 Tax=Streptomyces sp. NPDC055966 TaxID=3345669 RepID=UPI0035E11540
MTRHRDTPEEHDAPRDEKKTRERSAEERSIVAPTPKDVRAKSDDGEPEPQADDTKAP